ncbi:MAG: hypothetical protein AB1473_23480 [Thermodesulfobacteriota bacterium]
MNAKKGKYKAAVSSDWSECLSPNGPFDPLAFTYPELESELSHIFRQYTGNRISLTEATQRIKVLLPAPLTVTQMDEYLDRHFRTYRGVPELIEWCASRDILFMLNTTGTQGYFQRASAKGLIPEIPLVACNPLVQFTGESYPERYPCQVLEIEHKARCSQQMLEAFGIPAARLVVMGDSGGDGLHFKWAAGVGAFLIGSMIKQSLWNYCTDESITISHCFGLSYASGEPRDPEREMQVDFMHLTGIIEQAIAEKGNRTR